MFIFVALLSACIIQTVLNYFRLYSIPCTIFLLIGGFIWGACLLFIRALEPLMDAFKIPPANLLMVYVGIITFRLAFCMDVHTFYRSVGQILIISFIVSISTGVLTGVVISAVWSENWGLSLAILFGIMCTPTYPVLLIRMLKLTVSNTKQADVLLEAESLISSGTVLIVNEIILGYRSGYINKWYQFITVVLRMNLIGVLVGVPVAFLGRLVIRQVYEEMLDILAIIFGVPLIVNCVTFFYFGGHPVTALMIIGLIMGEERAILSKKASQYLSDFWRIAAAGPDVVITVYVATIAVRYCAASPFITWRHVLMSLLTYITYFSLRFFCFLMVFPILRRINFGLSFSNMIVCVWGGTKSSVSLLLVIMNYHASTMNDHHATIFYFHLIVLQSLTYFINGPTSALLLKKLGLTEISMARQINMNNCIKHVFAKRDRAIATLKMDRFLADTNWPMVYQATNMPHPYRLTLKNDEDDNFSLGYRYTNCPDCQRELVGEPTPKELREITREARLRILKTKKISYARQYENGMLSKQALRILNRAVDDAMDTEEALIEIDSLHDKMSNEGCFTRFIRNRAQAVTVSKKEITVKVPIKHCRRVCYYIVTHKSFEPIMGVIILLNMIPVSITIYFYATKTECPQLWEIALLTASTVFWILYVGEFLLKIFGYSQISIWRDGIPTYFKNCWNVFDFLILLGATADILIDYIDVSMPYNGVHTQEDHSKIDIILEATRFGRIARLLRLFEIVYIRIIKHMDANLNIRLTASYELGKTFVTGEDEVLEMLPHIIDHEKIRKEARRKIEKDRQKILQWLGSLQRDRPWIAITVKTKQAMRTVLNTMQEAIHQLKTSGWVDDDEYDKLLRSMEELYKKVNKIKSVQASAPKIIFREVPWMDGDETAINYLFDNIIVRTFEPNDVIFEEGEVANGIYVIIAGLLMLTYVPRSSVLEFLEEYGGLPIADYIPSSQFRERVVDYIATGNTIGEMSILTERPYNCVISAVTHTQIYVLRSAIVRKAMKLSPHPITGLKARMWKAESIRIAISILSSVPAYHSLRPDQIKYALERAFVPDLSNIQIFTVNNIIQDLLLIEGVVADFNTRELYTAPCYIPRTVQKLILPASSLMNMPTSVETKLMIIPEQDVGQAEITVNEDECTMHSSSRSNQCLQHTVSERNQRKFMGNSKQQNSKGSTAVTSDEMNPFEVSTNEVYLNTINEDPSYKYNLTLSSETDDAKPKRDNVDKQ